MKAIKLCLWIAMFVFTTSLSAQKVYTTKSGEKFHKSSCRYLKYSKKELTLKKAIQLGYEACKVCKPPKTINNSSRSNAASLSKSNTTTSKKKSTNTTKKTIATQCTGKTKSGSRCKRRTKSANGRCYQH